MANQIFYSQWLVSRLVRYLRYTSASKIPHQRLCRSDGGLLRHLPGGIFHAITYGFSLQLQHTLTDRSRGAVR